MPKSISKPHALFKGMPAWFSAFVLLIVLYPLPFGGNRPLVSDLFAVAIGLLLALMLWSEHKNQTHLSGKPPTKRLAVAAIGMTIVILWSLLQVVSWTPESWHHPIWKEASKVIGTASGSISVDTGVFPEALARLISYIACFIIALIAAQDSAKARRIVHALAYAAVAYAVYGLVVESTGSNSVLWYKKWAYTGFLTSTFVNKNSYAAYAGIGLLCTLALAWQHFKNLRPTDLILAKQSRFASVLASLSLKDFAIALMPVIMLGALALSGSRAGVASTVLGVLIFFLALAVNQKWGMKRWLGFLAIGFVVFVGFVAMGGDALLNRIDSGKLDNDTAIRLAAYKLEQLAINDNPWLGFGLGTFESAFRLYRDSTLSAWFHHAHNDYLEMMMDLGLPVALILFASLALLVSCCVTGIWVRHRNGVYGAVALGATAIVASHGLVDFDLHIPAIAATFATLLGVGVAQSWSSRDKEDGETRSLKKKKKA